MQSEGLGCVVEIKMRRRLSKSVINEVKKKVRRLKIGRQLSVRTVLVHAGDIDSGIDREKYFDFVVPFEEPLVTEIN